MLKDFEERDLMRILLVCF